MKNSVCAVVVLAVSTAQASTIHVDDDAPLGGDGLGWGTAYRFLQDALAVASTPANGIDEIRVAQGTYRPDRNEAVPDGTGDRTANFQLIDGVAVRGGYAGTGAPDPDARDLALYKTVLTGDLAGDDAPNFANNDENSHHVAYADGNDDTAVLEGVTITAGNADGAEEQQQQGGGMFCDVATPTLADCTFVANAAALDGGGLHNFFNGGAVFSCSFVGNAAGRDGGGVYDRVFATQLTDCHFNENLAFGNGGGAAGDVIAIGCVFTANIALDNGGGFWGDGPVANSSFIDNLAGNDGGGAAPRNNATMTNCQFDGNVADRGGGLYQYLALEVTDCTFAGNSADLGGAVYCFDDALTLTGCTFDGNAAIEGAGLYNDGASPTVTGCMFVANTADRGSGMKNVNSAGPLASGCTFDGNVALSGGGAAIHSDGSQPVVEGCFFTNNNRAVESRLSSTITVTDSTFEGNTGLHGAAMYSVSSAVTVTDCTFRNNRAEETSQSDGGAMANFNLIDLVVTNCQFVDNYASHRGGAMHNDQTDAEVTLCTFQNNAALNRGGAMNNTSFSNPIITDCTFDGNAATGSAFVSGSAGALAVTDGGAGTITGCVFSNNNAANPSGAFSAFGGALVVLGSDPLISDCTFIGNASDHRGGAVSVSTECAPYFVTCLFEDNTAATSGGAFYNGADSSATMINCRFIENSSLQLGGAITVDQCTPTLVNGILAGNTAQLGGGVYISFDSAAEMTNCTMIGNTADDGGGLYMDCSGPLNVLTNSIVRGNQASAGVAGIAGRLAVTYCNIEGGLPGAGNIDADPLFVDPDGPDETLATYGDNNYDLASGSPCIDAGDNTAVPTDATDIDGDGITGERIPDDAAGNPRFVDDFGRCDTGNGSLPNQVVDVGAFEFQLISSLVDCNGNTLTDQCDIALGIHPDCNGNGVPDVCDITSGSSIDCDGNGIPDECDVVVTFEAGSPGQLGGIYYGSPQSFTVLDPPTALDDVILLFTISAELAYPVEQIEVDINEVLVGSLFCEASICAEEPEPEYLVVPASVYNSAVGGANAEITMTATEFVEPICAPPSFITVAVNYKAPAETIDANGNGVPDDCDTPGDIDGDGVVGIADFLALLASWGPCQRCEPCLADLDGDCVVGITDMLMLLSNWS